MKEIPRERERERVGEIIRGVSTETIHAEHQVPLWIINLVAGAAPAGAAGAGTRRAAPATTSPPTATAATAVAATAVVIAGSFLLGRKLLRHLSAEIIVLYTLVGSDGDGGGSRVDPTSHPEKGREREEAKSCPKKKEEENGFKSNV